MAIDDRFAAEAAEDRAQEVRAREVLIAARDFAGRRDLFELAIEIRTVMSESHQLMSRATRLRDDAQTDAERQVLTRIIDGALTRHTETSEW
jgi:hypothetical protein